MVRFSNILVFLDVLMAQRTHGKTLEEIPDGRRHTAFWNDTSTSCIEAFSAMWTVCFKGICSNTFFLAKGHLKKQWFDVSVCWHLIHDDAEILPLLCRLAPRGSESFKTAHKNVLIFGEKFPAHTSLIQWKYVFDLVCVISDGEREAIKYPEFVE